MRAVLLTPCSSTPPSVREGAHRCKDPPRFGFKKSLGSPEMNIKKGGGLEDLVPKLILMNVEQTNPREIGHGPKL